MSENIDPNNNPKQKMTKSQVKREVMEWILILEIAVVIAVLVNMFLIVNAVIPSASMETTIMTGDRIFGNRLAYKNHDPQRGDIVIFRFPDDESQLFIKRIIGMPGDTVEFRDGDVYINNSEIPLNDEFCSVQDMTEFDPNRTTLTNPFTVPEDSYFVMGDNRLNSRDSRYWKNPFVKRDKILGEAVFRYWPLNKISVIHRYADTE